MDESEWGRCREPRTMLRFVETAVSERKLWLFACACCRFATQQLPGDRYLRAIDIGERFADHLASSITRQMVCEVVNCLFVLTPGGRIDAFLRDLFALLERFGCRAFEVAWLFSDLLKRGGEYQSRTVRVAVEGRYREFQCRVLRDLCGNPFTPVAVDPDCLAWHDGAVVKIARGIHETRAFDQMGILADALEDTGCINPAILEHCRAGEPHTRGCHVLDVILNKM